MEKIDVMRGLRQARKAHVLWVDRIKKLVNGLPIQENQISIEVTECGFGQWFYCDGQILLSIFSEHAVEKLENKHKKLHTIYLRIYKIYFTVQKRSFLSKMLKRQKTLNYQVESEALIHLDELEKISNELISYLNIIEKKLNSIEAERFRTFC